MNPETEAILKAMGLILHDDQPDAEDGTLLFFRPMSEPGPRWSLRLLPTTKPAALFNVIWNAGGEEARRVISRAHEAWLASMK